MEELKGDKEQELERRKENQKQRTTKRNALKGEW